MRTLEIINNFYDFKQGEYAIAFHKMAYGSDLEVSNNMRLIKNVKLNIIKKINYIFMLYPIAFIFSIIIWSLFLSNNNAWFDNIWTFILLIIVEIMVYKKYLKYKIKF